MKILRRELIKIARQFDGSENIFGYKSTVANQLYLFYCFSGKIYFTDKIHKQVKYLWYGIVSCQILFAFVIGWAYLWYEAVGNDLAAMFTVFNAIGSLLTTSLGFPSISFFYRSSIETMINRVDDILASAGVSDSNQGNVRIDAKKNLSRFFKLFVVFLMIDLFICFIDVALLFEESKVTNYLYYAYPLFLIRNCSSIEFYFIVNGISTMVFALMVFEGWPLLSLISYWGTVWYNELISLRNELSTAMRDLDAHSRDHGECSNDWNKAYEYILKRSVRKFRKITPLINDLREFFEVIGTAMFFSVFLYAVFFLYNSFSNDLSLVLVVKYGTSVLVTTVLVFIFYWIGQNLENSVSEVSMAIYSTPWYRSVKVRKNVYIFLCQTQSVKTFVVFKVYGLLLNNFSRYLHAVVSYANILYKLTQK